MVLVSDKPSNAIGILQTKLSDRERHETRHVGLEAMPLDEDIVGRHGKRQARLKIGPAPVHDLFEMADERQHREHRLHQHTVLPLPVVYLYAADNSVAYLSPADNAHGSLLGRLTRL